MHSSPGTLSGLSTALTLSFSSASLTGLLDRTDVAGLLGAEAEFGDEESDMAP